MTKLKNEIRELTIDELDAVTGGALDNCLPQPTVTMSTPNTAWTFKDVFAKHTIGQ